MRKNRTGMRLLAAMMVAGGVLFAGGAAYG